MRLINSILLFLCIQSATAGLTPINEIFSPDETRYPRGEYMKVAVLQWANTVDTPIDVTEVEAERYKQTNREQIKDYIEEAHQNGAELLITPEFAVVGYPSQPDADDNFASVSQAAPYAEDKQGPTFKYFSRIASTLKIYLHIGFLEKVKGERLFYNSVMVINPQGQLVTVYHKQNLFGGEYKFIKPGSGPVTYQSPIGKIGLGICADIYDYDFLSQYRKLQVDALSLSSSWTIHNSAYSYYQRAARDLNTIIMGSNHNYFPDSGVVNSDGTKQSHIRQSTGLAYGFLKHR